MCDDRSTAVSWSRDRRVEEGLLPGQAAGRRRLGGRIDHLTALHGYGHPSDHLHARVAEHVRIPAWFGYLLGYGLPSLVMAERDVTDPPVLRLLMDTSTWLELAKSRDGRRLVRPLQRFVEDSHIELLVPQVVLDEFDRNRDSVKKTMTTSLTERIKAFRKELTAYAEMDYRDQELRLFDQWSYQVSLSAGMTTRNFEDIATLLAAGKRLEPTSDERDRVVVRALAKTAPCHRQRNSVADALLIELYTTAIGSAGPVDTYAFVTSNSDDFSSAQGDKRQPHEDLADAFEAEYSTHCLGVEGLEKCLRDEFGDYLDELIHELDFPDDLRGLDEILTAEKELFDKVWYERSMRHDRELIAEGKRDVLEEHQRIAAAGRERVEKTYGVENLGPFDAFDLGMLNGKLSALRWVLGSEWDFLDT